MSKNNNSTKDILFSALKSSFCYNKKMRKVLCFGDSNTFGFNPQNGRRFDENTRWTGILQKLCIDRCRIVEAGCNNRTAFADNPAGKMFTGNKILPEILKDDFEYIILSLGINDLQSQYNISVEEIKNGILNLVKIVRQNLPKSKIILVSPAELTKNVLKSPVFSTLFNEKSVKKSKYLAQIYEQIAKTTDCDYVDLNKVATPSKVDGLHFEAEGHKKIATEIFHRLIF